MGRRRKAAHTHGVLVIDKPSGMTSHDVVSRVRRLFDQRRVGHAGTLDPAATGVLLVLLGEATKLASYLTGQDKAYAARVSFGRATDTLDADGQVTAEAPLPDWWNDRALAQARVEAALASERARVQQLPPVYSAIKVAGQASHRLARRGQAPELPPRPVAVRALTLEALHPDGSIDILMSVSKGYYVRSLGRDIGGHLGLPAHLSRLRRTASGPFSIAQALALDAAHPDALLSLSDAARVALPTAQLNTEGRARARQGQPLDATHFAAPPPDELAAWLADGDELVALGEATADGFKVVRGFRVNEH